MDCSRGQEERNDNSGKVFHGDMTVLTEEWGLWMEVSLCPVWSNLGWKTQFWIKVSKTDMLALLGLKFSHVKFKNKTGNSVSTVRTYKAFALLQLPWTQKVSRPPKLLWNGTALCYQINNLSVHLFYPDFSVRWSALAEEFTQYHVVKYSLESHEGAL